MLEKQPLFLMVFISYSWVKSAGNLFLLPDKQEVLLNLLELTPSLAPNKPETKSLSASSIIHVLTYVQTDCGRDFCVLKVTFCARSELHKPVIHNQKWSNPRYSYNSIHQMKNSLITATARIRAQLFSCKLAKSILVRFSISTIEISSKHANLKLHNYYEAHVQVMLILLRKQTNEIMTQGDTRLWTHPSQDRN